MNFRNTNKGILIRRWSAKRLFYPVYCWQYLNIYYKLFLNKKSKPLVIILTVGKVGSSSVYYSVKNQLTNRIFHIHYISDNGIKTSWDKHKFSSRGSVPLHLITSKILSNFLKRLNEKIYVITVFREPVQRKISSFFQNLDQFENELNLKGLKFDVSKIDTVLNDSYFINLSNEEDFWIRDELINTFGFIVYKQDDINKRGFSIERKDNIDLLVLRMEDFNFSFESATSEFFNSNDGLILEKFNDGNDKYYSHSYKDFKRKFKLSSSVLDEITSTNYFNTFYNSIKPQVNEKWRK